MVGVGVTSLSRLEEAVRDFHRDHRPYHDDPKRLRAAIDALELEFSSMVRRVQQRGDHLLDGNVTAASWVSRTCAMSVTSAADRLCVGEQLSLPISTRTLERIACDCTISRVLLADSMVIDVGRATRVNSAPRRRALRVRDKGCRFPGCDRPVNWSTPHHIVAWSRGGSTNLANE